MKLQKLKSALTTSLSDFRADPMGVIEASNKTPVAILNRNLAVGYIWHVDPQKRYKTVRNVGIRQLRKELAKIIKENVGEVVGVMNWGELVAYILSVDPEKEGLR